jgi:dihydroorotate dehydrogenase (NAD+) catalytic subunit
MIYQVYQAVKLPILGGGGILNYIDALEFILVGATAVSVGTGNFVNPCIARELVEDIEKYLLAHNIKSLEELRGAAH